MALLPRRWAPPVAIGIAFLAIGMTSNRAFLYMGIVFIIIGIVRGAL